jgi:transcription antitermination factor NusG
VVVVLEGKTKIYSDQTRDGIAPSGGAALKNWHVIQTNRHKELATQRYLLTKRQIASYLPRIVQWPRPAVGNAIAPMFPGYLFIHAHLPDEFARISWSPGVRSFVGFGEGPAIVDAEVIDFLRGREGPDGLIHCGEPLQANNEVRITDGPFRGLTAIVCDRVSSRDRVRVLMDILQRQTQVELPEKWLRRA